MVVALILLLVAVASVLFHLFSPWWWTPIASNWSYIDHTITLTFWITGAVFFAVVAFMAYCVFPIRHGSGRCDRGRGRGTAVDVELSASRKGRAAWDLRCPQCQFRQSFGVEFRRSKRTRRRRYSKRRLAPAGWE